MEQNPDPFFDDWIKKPYDYEEFRGLDEPPLGFSDGSDVNSDNLGFLARTYFGVRGLFNMDWVDGVTGIEDTFHRKPPPHG